MHCTCILCICIFCTFTARAKSAIHDKNNIKLHGMHTLLKECAIVQMLCRLCRGFNDLVVSNFGV